MPEANSRIASRVDADLQLVDSDYRKIHELATAYARRHGFQIEAEDFAQECAIYAFKSQKREVFLSRRFADYLRQRFGRSGSRRDAIFVEYCDEIGVGL